MNVLKTKIGTYFIAIAGVFILSLSMAHARSKECISFLSPHHPFEFQEWPIAKDYRDLHVKLQKLETGDSIRKVVTLFNTFKDDYHERYNQYIEALIARYPELERDRTGLRLALQPFYKIENKVLTSFNTTILKFPAKKRFHYLRNLPARRLKDNEVLLDALVGINVQETEEKVLEEISTNGVLDRKKQKQVYGYENIYLGKTELIQSNWRDLITWIENANLQEGQIVADLGSGMGRLGFLIAILRPDLQFIGIEMAGPRVRMGNDIVRQAGLSNVTFIHANLADKNYEIPPADHIYLFNPTTPDTSENLADSIIKLASSQKIQVHVNHKFDSYIFNRHFHEVDDLGGIKIYEYHR